MGANFPVSTAFTDASPVFDPYRVFAPIAAALVMLQAGEQEQAERMLNAVAAHISSSHRDRGRSAYGIHDVATYSLLGETERALDQLAEIAETGYLRDWKLLEVAPQFSAIRGTPRFKEAVATLAAKAAEMREIGAREGLLRFAQTAGSGWSEAIGGIPTKQPFVPDPVARDVKDVDAAIVR